MILASRTKDTTVDLIAGEERDELFGLQSHKRHRAANRACDLLEDSFWQMATSRCTNSKVASLLDEVANSPSDTQPPLTELSQNSAIQKGKLSVSRSGWSTTTGSSITTLTTVSTMPIVTAGSPRPARSEEKQVRITTPISFFSFPT